MPRAGPVPGDVTRRGDLGDFGSTPGEEAGGARALESKAVRGLRTDAKSPRLPPPASLVIKLSDIGGIGSMSSASCEPDMLVPGAMRAEVMSEMSCCVLPPSIELLLTSTHDVPIVDSGWSENSLWSWSNCSEARPMDGPASDDVGIISAPKARLPSNAPLDSKR